MQKQKAAANGKLAAPFSFQYSLAFREPEPAANGMDIDDDTKPSLAASGVALLTPLVASLNLKKRRLDREENSEYGQRAKAKHYDFWHRINARIEGPISQNLDQLEVAADTVYVAPDEPTADGDEPPAANGDDGSETE